jgi:DNA-binding beta-propeller fold protein YncE
LRTAGDARPGLRALVGGACLAIACGGAGAAGCGGARARDPEATSEPHTATFRHDAAAPQAKATAPAPSTPRVGAITTICGDDSSGWNGDGRPALETRFSYPAAIAFDREGRLVIVDSGNHRVRRVESDGHVRTILGGDDDAATGLGGADAEHAGGHHHGAAHGAADGSVHPHHPYGIDVAGDGALLVAGNLDPRIYRIAPDGAVTIAAGGDSSGGGVAGGSAATAPLRAPLGVAAAPNGAIYIADTGSHRVLRVSPNGAIETIAGTGESGFSGDGGPAAAARLKSPFRVTVDPLDGAVLIADSGNHRIRRVAPDGTIATIAGLGEAGFSGDGGPAVAARLNAPEEARRGPDGALYISDSANHRVRRFRRDGTIETVAGDGFSATRGDGGDARAASLRHPSGLAFDARGDLAIAEAYGHCVRLVRLTPAE